MLVVAFGGLFAIAKHSNDETIAERGRHSAECQRLQEEIDDQKGQIERSQDTGRVLMASLTNIVSLEVDDCLGAVSAKQARINLRLEEGIVATRWQLTNAVLQVDRDMDDNYSRSENHLAALQTWIQTKAIENQ